MKQKGESMKQRILLIAITLIGAPVSMHAVRQILGNNLLTSTFQQTVNCSVFHRPTQSLYVGLSAPTSTTTTTTTTGPQVGDYSISRSTPIYDGHVPSFIPLCSTPASSSSSSTTTTTTTMNGSALTGQAITGLALMSSSDPLLAQNPLVACITASPATTLSVLNSTGTQYNVSTALNDSAGGTPPTQASAILKIAASQDHIFAAVNGSSVTTPNTFGSNVGDGIALTGVTRGATGLTFTYHNTGTGSTTSPIAVRVNDAIINSVVSKITGGFSVTDAAAAGGAGPLQNLTGNILDMYYDADLQRVYVSTYMVSGTTNTNIICGFVILKYDPVADTLVRLAQYNTGVAITDNNRIIAGLRTGGNDARVVLEKISVLHTSTGYPYLVVVGGVSTGAAGFAITDTPTTRNTVYALPLVHTGAGAGRLAQDGDLGVATTTLATGATLPTTATAATMAAMQIGGGNLPIVGNDSSKGVTWLECIGDTVFVSVEVDVTDTSNTGGIFYSQAQFNNFGKIVRWTDWAKAAPNQLGGNASDGSVQAFGLSAISGAMWGVEVGGQNVYRTEWTESGTPVTATSVPLVAALNNNFSNGCFSVFDLNQSVSGFGDDVANRYALFGGQNQVAFALISTAAGNGGYFAVQNTVISDFSLPANFMMTQLPAGAGPVTVLGYSGGLIDAANTQGLFLRGLKVVYTSGQQMVVV